MYGACAVPKLTAASAAVQDYAWRDHLWLISHIDLLRACINDIARAMNDQEAIVGIRQRLTIFSRNAQIPFLVDVATLDGTGQVTGSKRMIAALVTSTAPHQVQLLPTGTLPLLDQVIRERHSTRMFLPHRKLHWTP